jgi:hypothetical protein
LESSCVLLQEDGGFVPVGIVVVVELVVVMLLLLLLLLMRGTIMRSSSGCISDDDAASASLGLSEIHVFMAISDSLEAIELSMVSFN